jgi:hypothetical protein
MVVKYMKETNYLHSIGPLFDLSQGCRTCHIYQFKYKYKYMLYTLNTHTNKNVDTGT